MFFHGFMYYRGQDVYVCESGGLVQNGKQADMRKWGKVAEELEMAHGLKWGINGPKIAKRGIWGHFSSYCRDFLLHGIPKSVVMPP